MLLNLVFVKIPVIFWYLLEKVSYGGESEPADDERDEENVIYFSNIFCDIDLLLQK